MSHPFHTDYLHNHRTPVDRLAWLLATATTPTPFHRLEHGPTYRREAKRLWNLEAHRRAVVIREVLDDLGAHPCDPT